MQDHKTYVFVPYGDEPKDHIQLPREGDTIWFGDDFGPVEQVESEPYTEPDNQGVTHRYVKITYFVKLT